MKVAYFDSSAIVKLVHLEAESLALLDYLSDENIEASTSVIADIEVRRALRRVRADGGDASAALRGFYLLSLETAIRDEAAAVGSAALRSLDAIHLATALAIDDDLDFITYDERMAATAREHGLRVVQPGR